MKEWEQILTNFEVTKNFLSQVTAVLDRCRRAVTGHMYRTRLRADTVVKGLGKNKKAASEDAAMKAYDAWGAWAI